MAVSGFDTDQLTTRRREVEETLERTRRRHYELVELSARARVHRAEVKVQRERVRAQIALRRSLLQGSDRRAAAALLEAAWAVSGLDIQELWLDYFALGGDAGVDRVADLLAGRAPLYRADHDRLAVALNERFSEVGWGHPVAYWDGSH